MMAAFGQPVTPPAALATLVTFVTTAKSAPTEAVEGTIPLPPPRPIEFGFRNYPAPASETARISGAADAHGEVADGVRVPPEAPGRSRASAIPAGASGIISGAQAILPPRFAAFVTVR